MNKISRRSMLKMFCALPLAACLVRIGNAQDIPDFSQLKAGYAQRLKRILAAGELPYERNRGRC
jgi:hypothetical protein